MITTRRVEFNLDTISNQRASPKVAAIEMRIVQDYLVTLLHGKIPPLVPPIVLVSLQPLVYFYNIEPDRRGIHT
jgi:hypothetical protein